MSPKTKPSGRTSGSGAALPLAYGLCVPTSTVHRGNPNEAAPHGRNEIIFADHAVAVLNQVDQKVENLRLKGYRRASRAQFPALAVERKIIEQKQHVAPPQSQLQIIPGGSSKAKSRLPQGQIKRGSKPLAGERRIHVAENGMERGMQTETFVAEPMGSVT
jgi:hypothetical protein